MRDLHSNLISPRHLPLLVAHTEESLRQELRNIFEANGLIMGNIPMFSLTPVCSPAKT